jgi:hypothetical protein
MIGLCGALLVVKLLINTDGLLIIGLGVGMSLLFIRHHAKVVISHTLSLAVIDSFPQLELGLKVALGVFQSALTVGGAPGEIMKFGEFVMPTSADRLGICVNGNVKKLAAGVMLASMFQV